MTLELSRDVLLLIPTHQHPGTLELAVASALNQSVEDIDIVIIGDGVDSQSRIIAQELEQQQPRVTFLDRPKAVRHGEEYRDEVIRASKASFVTYLGDDDLLFADHVEWMLSSRDGADFVNPLPIMINRDGSLEYFATDLADPLSIQWHLDENQPRNSVSLTGVLHTKAAYLRLTEGWTPAPAGRWTDHFMWRKFFLSEGFSARTAQRATTAKFHNSQREEMSAAERAAEVRAFWDSMADAGFIHEWNQRVAERIHRDSTERFGAMERIDGAQRQLRQHLDDLEQARAGTARALEQERQVTAELTHELESLRANSRRRRV